MIEFQNVTKRYGSKIALNDANITIEDHDFVFIVGPTGAGKSTFIKLLSKELDPDEGEIIVDGVKLSELSNREIPSFRRKIGMVFQDFKLMDKMTVHENVSFAKEVVHCSQRVIQKQVPQLLAIVGVAEHSDKYPNQLSQGEQQRVAIARAIANNPEYLIADEPTGNLDPDTAWKIMELLDAINRRGTTVVVVTHSKEIVNRMGKRVISIEDGRVVSDKRGGMYFGA